MSKPGKKAKKITPEDIRIPASTIIEDPLHRKWSIGERISTGAFGAVFDCEFHAGKSHLLPPNTDFVIKVEPSENGTLFTENLFFMRVGHPNKVDAWLKKTKKSSIGIPHYVTSSVKEIEGIRYRYLIMEKLLPAKLQTKSVDDLMRIAAKLIDTIEFVHSAEFSHHDIKEDNIMLSNRTDASYLIDFGIATSIKENPVPCPNLAGNGTRHFMSRDAFIGMITKRSDIESLFYNLMSWLSDNNLPWKNCKTAAEVQNHKELAFNNIPNFVDDLLPTHIYKDKLIEFGDYVKTLSENDQPDYDRLRAILAVGEKPAKSTMRRRKIEVNRKPVVENGAAYTNGNHVNGNAKEAAPTAPPSRARAKKTKPVVRSDSDEDDPPRMVLRPRK